MKVREELSALQSGDDIVLNVDSAPGSAQKQLQPTTSLPPDGRHFDQLTV